MSIIEKEAIGNIEEASKVKPILIEFEAPWCKYCKRIAPAAEQLAGELTDVMDLMKVDIDLEEAMAEEYEIRTIPSFVLYSGGVKSETLVNPGSKVELLKWLRSKGI